MDISPDLLGSIIEVRFLDHMSGGKVTTDELRCRTWGELITITPVFITIYTWKQGNEESENNSFNTIVRTTITDIKQLTYLGD